MPDAAEAAVGAATWLSRLGTRPVDETEALALVVHALLLRHGFRTTNSELSEPGMDPIPAAPASLPPDWSPTATRSGYGTRYRHFRSSMTFQVRSLSFETDHVLFVAYASEQSETTFTLCLRPSEYLRERVTKRSGEDKPLDWTEAIRAWQKLASLVQIEMVHKLVPESAKDGYESCAQSSRSTTGDDHVPRRSAPRPDDHRHDPRVVRAPSPIVGIGDDDLYPRILPQGNWAPERNFFSDDGDRGMLVGPSHPLFRDRNRAIAEGRLEPDRLPPGAVPPGARFDPFGPDLPPDARPRLPGTPSSRDGFIRRSYGDLDPPPPDTMYM